MAVKKMLVMVVMVVGYMGSRTMHWERLGMEVYGRGQGGKWWQRVIFGQEKRWGGGGTSGSMESLFIYVISYMYFIYIII